MRSSSRIARLFSAEALMLGFVATSLLGFHPAKAASNDPFGQMKSTEDEEDDGSWSERIGDTFKNAMTNATKSVGLGGKPEGPAPLEAPSGCPTIAILEGTASSRVSATGASGNQGVRYQYSLNSVGRQCSISGGRVSMRVAASGRVLLGPAGTAGSFGVPLRIVVFSESQSKPVASKLYKAPASIGSGQSSGTFNLVTEDIVVPTSGRPSSEYSIKVGIDAGKGGDAVASTKGKRRKQREAASQ